MDNIVYKNTNKIFLVHMVVIVVNLPASLCLVVILKMVLDANNRMWF